MTFLAAGLCAFAMVLPTVAPEEARGPARVDVGTSFGFNNPAGMYGLEGDVRILDHVSLGVGAGFGLWGPRITPQARLYPFGISATGLFLELGSSMNLGGEAEIFDTDGTSRTLKLLMTPTANGSVGFRFGFGRHAWLALRAGYAFRLRSENVELSDGGAPDVLTGGVLGLMQPGGFVAGLSGGFAVL